MTILQHITNQAERMLATVLPGAWQPVISAMPVKLTRDTYRPLSSGAYCEPTDGLLGHQVRGIRGFKAESSPTA